MKDLSLRGPRKDPPAGTMGSMEQVRKLEGLDLDRSRLEGVRDKGFSRSLWDPTGIIQLPDNA